MSLATPKYSRPRSGLVVGFIAVGLVSSCVMTPVGCAYHGRRRAQRSCDETPIGSNIDDFRARSRRDMDMVFEVPDDLIAQSPPDASDSDGGAATDARDTGRKKRVTAMAVGFAFLRYFCDVEYSDGKVTAKRLTSLD